MATIASIRMHDRVRLRRAVDGVPAGSLGNVVQVFENGWFGVELDDPYLTERTDGIVDVVVQDIEVLAHLPSE